MNSPLPAAPAPLTLVHSASAQPVAHTALGRWRERALAVWSGSATPREQQQRGLAEIMFGEVACHPHAVCEATPAALAAVRFSDAGAASQGELAEAALRELLAGLDAPTLRRCKLALYGTASVDDHFFRSTLSGLAASHGFSAVPHFGLAQLQGATLAAAAEVAEAMLTADGEAALLLAADAWPLPLPRHWDTLAPLGDGATALWLVRTEQPGLQFVGARQSSFDPFVREREGVAAPLVDQEALFEAASATLAVGLSELGVEAADLGVWLESGLAPVRERGIDARLRERLGALGAESLAPAPDEGYLCAAAAPALLGQALARSRAGAWLHGTLVLCWGASLGGGVGMSLWRVCAPVEN
ncbi:MAG: hypothetical protein ING89_13510 [Rubrivivax sp.]|nr:hypothetical protein [Rubrivivax sp.]